MLLSRFFGQLRQTRKITVALAVVLLVVIGALAGCRPAAKAKEYTDSQMLMGTVVSVRIYGKNAEKAAQEAFSRMREIENSMSRNVDSSEVARINELAGKQPVQVSEDTFQVIQTALKVARLSKGKFDPTIGPLVDAWAIGTEHARIPPQGEIERLLTLVDWQAIELNPEDRTVFLTRPGMKLDLGGIAKGYAADEVVRIFRKHGVKSAFVTLGGNVYVVGRKPDDSLWRIGVRNPFVLEGQPYMAIVTGADISFVTSGTYERYFIQDGRRYHHLLDPDQGYPADSDLESVTIVTDNSMLADALSTAVFVLGKEKGIKLVKDLKDIEAILIDRQKRVWVSPGLQGRVRLVKEGFTFDAQR